MENKTTLYNLYEICSCESSNIIYYDGLNRHSMCYNELYNCSNFISQLFSDLFLSEQNICCLLKPSLALPAIILGILKVSSTFAFLDDHKPIQELQNFQKYLEVKTLLVEDYYLKDLNLKLCNCWKKLCQFHKYSNFTILQSSDCKNKYCPSTKVYIKSIKQSDVAYSIQTSGTTGEAKIVQVPHECIISNIIDLRSRFSVTSCDIILQSTRLTFDPSIIEIFLSLSSGASLIIIADHIRTNPQKLIEIIAKENVTIFQATPSLIYNFGEALLKNVLLCDKSTLRILAFGGEICPSMNKLQRWKSKGNKTELYNLYGLTELSCWASCFKIDFDNINFLSSVPIGEPLLDTKFYIHNENGEVVDKGELYVGSDTKRFCIINNEMCPSDLKHFLRPTGDLVFKASDGFIYFEGRKDWLIKHMGHKVSIKYLSDILEKYPDVANHLLHYDSASAKLYLFITWISKFNSENESKQKLLNYLKSNISNLPAIIIVPVAFIPLTKHGKGDFQKLIHHANEVQKKRNYLESISNNDIDDIIVSLWKSHTNQLVILDNDSFIEKGGDSIAAVQFAAEIEWQLQLQLPLLVEKILNEVFKEVKTYVKFCFKNSPESIKTNEYYSLPSTNQALKKRRHSDIFQCFQVCFKQGVREHCKHVIDSEKCFSKISRNSESQEFYFNLAFAWNLKKCVDATPCILYIPCISELLIFIGSHYGMFSCIDVNKQSEKWQVLVPDRIESSACVSACGRYVLFGCFDHHLYCINITDGTIHWKYETGAEIKSSPSISLHNKVFVGSHDKHVYSIDVQNGLLLWKSKVAYGSIFSSPTIIEEIDAICVGTLDGILALLKMASGEILWKYNAEKPLFSSPLVTSNHILIGSTNNCILSLDFSGRKEFVYATEGPIFSSAANHKDCKDQIVFGCHDSFVYCITLDGHLIWKTLCNSAIYSTPSILKFNCTYYVCAVSSEGTIYFFNLRNGKIIFSWTCPGEIFSSPVILNDILVIGCRDDNIYCFNLTRCINNV